jgi:Family of unknown function (DUF5678)
MSRWWGSILRRGPKVRKMNPIRRPPLEGLDGKWVAIRDRRVIAAADRPDELYAHLHELQIEGATIIRVPGDGEPEMVGLG